MKTRELLSQLTRLEEELESFSFEDLNAAEAQELKNSFNSFKTRLYANMFNELGEEGSQDKSHGQSDGTELIANVSHEIRTPLNGILGFISLLQETPLNPAQQEITNALTSASNNLLQIVNELLDYAQLASGVEKFELVPFNLKNLINEVAFLGRTLLVDKSIKLNARLDDEMPEFLLGDPSKLSQVVLNLLGNAIKFVEKGSIDLEVKAIKTNATHTLLQFEIRDTGIGIAPKNLNRIFESFQQGDKHTQEKYGGTGLGLSIVQKIVENQGGNIKVASQLGVGTTFTFQLPFKLDLNHQKRKSKIIRKPQTQSLEGTTVLVMEDNTLNQKLFQNQLKLWGCETLLALNGAEGLAILENNEVDIVLMDLRMPGMSGFQISETIRSHKNSRINALPIIAISADFTVADKENYESSGINDFLLKPYNADKLLQKIGTLLRKTSELHNNYLDEDEEVDQKINLQPMLKECLGKVDLLESLVQLFKSNVLEFIGKMKCHIDSNDFSGIDFATHKLKSCLTMMRANSLVSICDEMANCTEGNNDLKTLIRLHEQFIEEYKTVETEIDYKLNELK